MKNQLIILAMYTAILASCNNQSKQKATSELPAKMNEPTTCFSFVENNDKVLMNITITDDLVEGDLFYKYSGKDKNSGKIKGQMYGDTLVADYTFMSEGVNSVREVAFLKKDNVWNEGYSEVEEQKGKTVFKNRSALKFENKMPLIKTECNTN